MLKNWLRKKLRTWLGVADPVVEPLDNRASFMGDMNARHPNEGLEAWVDRLRPRVMPRTIEHVKFAQPIYAQDGAIKFAEDAGGFSGDGFNKSIFAFGGNVVPEAQLSWYAAQSFIGYQMCAILMQHWFISKACWMPARDAVRNGWELTVSDGQKLTPEMLKEYTRIDKAYRVEQECTNFLANMRGFGVRVLLFEVASSDPDYYTKPFNPDGVTPGSYKGISQVDPYWITPELDWKAAADPASRHFYEPTFWRINGVRYHRSHLIVRRYQEVPDVLKPTYFFGGIPLPQLLYERAYAADRTANEAPQLALTKRSVVVKMDMDAAVADPVKFRQKMDWWSATRDNYGVKAIGLADELNQYDTTLTDVDTVIMTQFQIACSIVNVPATKMLGVQPKGFNATGEYEEANYHEDLESMQAHDVMPILERHYLLSTLSFIKPKFQQAPQVIPKFNDLDAETAAEKAKRRLDESQADKNWSDTGAVDGTDIRERLIKSKDLGWDGLTPDMPEGPTPKSVVQPGAQIAAPNTAPGATPQPAPAPPAANDPRPPAVGNQ